MKRISVLLVDDHEVVRAGLRALLSHEPRIQVVGEAGTSAEAIRLARALSPDVVMMDVRLPDQSGVAACREIRGRAPRTQVLMLTSYADEEAVLAAILAGAAGYLLKRARGHELARAIETVAGGGSLLDPGLARTVLEQITRAAHGRAADPLASLSPQEARVLALVADGKTNKEIGTVLELSDKTVKNYLARVFDKLEVSRRAEAAALFARRQSHSALIPSGP